MVRSRSSNFQINIFAQEAHVSDSEYPQDSIYVISFLLRCVELTNIGSQKIIDAMPCSLYIAIKTHKIDIFKKMHVHIQHAVL